MNDTRFKWLVVAVSVVTVAIVAMIILPDKLKSRAPKKTEPTLSEYVYIDIAAKC